jgi:lipopolysaccharide/colanic/teichoic acid biosynthesis glycosyltransferase
MSNGKLDGFSQMRHPSWIGRDNHPAPFLRRIVSDSFQRGLASPSSITGKENLPGSNGKRVSHAASELSATSLRRVPGWKAGLDITCILISLPLWLPLMILLMLVTRIASPGPIFYRQERIGFGGRHFFIWKFRTMKLSAETQAHERHLEKLMRVDCPMTKLDAYGDPRLAPFGRILRASGLDELPQIFNVLCGEMSLVGPRPCLPNEFAHYEPRQRERVNGLPGLTGYWQVNGKNKTTFKEMIEMDLFYLKNMSILLDLKIMLKTGAAIAGQLVESRLAAQRDRPEQGARLSEPILQSLTQSVRKT